MAKVTRNTLKGYFETGQKPVGANYVDLLDSYLLVNGENTGSIDIQGSITASGDISASGTIYADTFQSHGNTEIGISDSLNITGGITSSGGISASGNIIGGGNITTDGWISASSFVSASHFSGDGRGLTNITASQINYQQITASVITGSIGVTGSLTYTSGSTSVLYAMQASGSIIPDSGSTWDLGGPDHVWRDLWLSENSMRFVSSSGEITRFNQEDARRLKTGKPAKLDTAIGGFDSIIRPEAIMSALNTTDYQKWTVEGRIGTFLGGNLIHDMNFNGENNYISMGKSNATTQVIITGSLEVSGSSTFTNWGNFRNRFKDKHSFEVSTDPTVAGGWRYGLATPNTGSAPHLHFMLSGSGQAGIGLLNPEHTLHVSASSADFNALQVEGGAIFNGFLGANAVGNLTTLSTTTIVPANYNTVLYGPITVGANALLDIAVDAQVLVKDLANA